MMLALTQTLEVGWGQSAVREISVKRTELLHYALISSIQKTYWRISILLFLGIIAASHLISKESNEYDSKIMVDAYKSKHHKEYEQWLKEEYGENIIEVLESEIDISKPFTKQDYIKTIEYFRNA